MLDVAFSLCSKCFLGNPPSPTNHQTQNTPSVVTFFCLREKGKASKCLACFFVVGASIPSCKSEVDSTHSIHHAFSLGFLGEMSLDYFIFLLPF